MKKLSRHRILFGQAIIVAIASGFWFAARDPLPARTVVGDLASRFQFKKFVLPAAPNHSMVNYTAVTPHPRKIATWLSSAGPRGASFDLYRIAPAHRHLRAV